VAGREAVGASTDRTGVVGACRRAATAAGCWRACRLRCRRHRRRIPARLGGALTDGGGLVLGVVLLVSAGRASQIAGSATPYRRRVAIALAGRRER
jgi:hypothetical protein